MIAPLDVFSCRLSGSALIEASAGTGKTWAICGLALRLVAENALPVSEILVVTFTKAATAELKQRIRTRLVDTLAFLDGADPGDDPFAPRLIASLADRGIDRDTARARFAAALAGFDEAAIFTIHGFCQRALAELPFAAGQPFTLELTDNVELCREVVADFWRRRIAFGKLPAGFADYVNTGALKPATLEKLLKRHLTKPLTRLVWPTDAMPPPADLTALHSAYATAAAAWTSDAGGAEHALLKALSHLPATIHHADKVRDGAAAWRHFFALGDAQAVLPSSATNYRRGKLKPKKNGQPPQHPFFDAAEALLSAREALQQVFQAHVLALLRELLDWGLPEMRRRKRERRQQSFDDLLFKLHDALHTHGGDGLATALSTRYRAALIDEFQDTDPLQFAIFKRLYNNRATPLFMVGDPKQAIYSFRQADLHTYLAAREQADARYALVANQRSSAALIEAVNGIFAANPAAFILPGLDFSAAIPGDKRRRHLHDASRGRAMHCWQLPSEPPLKKPEAMAYSAQATAAEIARLLKAGNDGDIRLDGEALMAGDIAVLVRTHAQGQRIKRALADVGLAAAELSPASVFASRECEELECLLTAIAEPARPDRLKAALATSLMGLDAAAILALADDDSALSAWIERQTDWLQTWQTRGLAHLLARLFAETGMAGRLLAAAGGERRLTNLRHLGELLHQAESEQSSPESLLGWLAARRLDPPKDDTAQLRLESDRRLVSIITIHKAKGLEYPIVFCPFVWEGVSARRGEKLPGVEYHDSTGAPVIDFGEADESSLRRERAAEHVRLLYVALTRAEHRLYLVCGPYVREVRGGLSTSESRKSLLNWLLAGSESGPARWLTEGGDGAQIASAWQHFASQHASAVTLTPLPINAGRPVAPPEPSPPALSACSISRTLRPDWRLDSFSGLIRGASLAESAASDHDAHARSPEAEIEAPADDILSFPRGPQAGDCIHAVFERADFADASTWPAAITSALADFPPGGQRPASTLAIPLQQMLSKVLATPLPGGACLADIPRRRRLAELEFTLPAARLDAAALDALFTRQALAVPKLAFRPLSGWIKGFIDLVFASNGRYFVLDWKSNHLGHTPADYSAATLSAAMFEHGYTLQALIYQLALHRHLAHCLPDYDPTQHLGGALYLFIRGVRPEWGDAGIHHCPPDLGLLEEFSRMIAP